MSFRRETAKIQEVYTRRVTPAGDKYLRAPFNLIRYAEDSVTYIEPTNYSTGPYTYSDVNTVANDAEFLIVDAMPFSGITEFS